MTAVPDPVAAVEAVLKADSSVSALTANRVFGGELPDSENPSMPRKCAVIRPAGGPGTLGGGYQQIGDMRLDVTCYGETPHEAFLLYTAVNTALKQMRRQTQAATRLHWCRRAGGPLSLREPSGGRWPYCLSVWQILASEVPVT